MIKISGMALAGLLSMALLAGCASPGGETVAEKRQSVQQMRAETLVELYEIHPEAKAEIDQAVGYGVFSNVNVNLLLVSAGNGWGVVRDGRSGDDIYMKMISGGIGPGLGVKDFRGVLVFTDADALTAFVEDGWDANAQADAAAKSEEKGDAWAGAVEIAPGILLYQITRQGLALQATIQGTKFWKDEELSDAERG